MAARTSFDEVSSALKSILTPYAKDLVVDRASAMGYALSTSHLLPNGQKLFFAGVRKGKSYVSFYLMPVYMFPELLDGVSPTLSKRMQGKSCFNFKTADPAMLKELAKLTKASFARYKKEKLL